MLDYSLCDRTVTRYRRVGNEIARQVLDNCFYRYEDCVADNRFQRKFVLIHPGTEPICPGDRILEGIGPDSVNWEEFLPVQVPTLSQVAYAAPCCWEGQITHWEAGRK